jgi:hypothetical protein
VTAPVRKRSIGRPCVVCGRRTYTGSRCEVHAAQLEATRQARQPYRAAYRSAEYRAARRRRLDLAAGRCEFVDEAGVRCPRAASETHHVIPLSSAMSYDLALALCTPVNLRAVCHRHNPRPGPPPRRR